MLRLSLFVAQITLISAGISGATSGLTWEPVDQSTLPPATRAGQYREAKERHLAAAWTAIRAAATAPTDLRKQHTDTAREKAEAALNLGPANGFAWLALGWARTLSGDPIGGQDALRRSWEWAPYVRSLAIARVQLGLSHWHSLRPQDRAKLVSELRLARQADPIWFRDAQRANPRLAAAWRLAVAQGLDRSWFPTSLGKDAPAALPDDPRDSS